MTYATKDDLIAAFGLTELINLSDRATPRTGNVDDAVVNEALEDADGEINSYIAARVPTPVSPVPRMLKTVACAIARYRLSKNFSTERMRNDYQDAVSWLKSVANGTVSIGDSTAPTEAPTGGTPQFAPACNKFTRDKLKDF